MRIIFALVAKYIMYLPYLGFLAIMPAVDFLIFLFLEKERKVAKHLDKNMVESFTSYSSLLYALFAYLAINKNKNSHFVLFLDVFIGFVSFLHYHYSVNSFSKLF